MSLEPGTRLGPYEIRALLGAGGMGEVYRAYDPKLAREVAIKVLPGAVASDSAALERFEREARTVAALSHPNILAIYDFGTDDGRAYAAMELLEGETLRERLTRGPVGPAKTSELARRIARGLGAAHEKGIVHRDLKPDNVFITTDGQAKVLDFGLAAIRDVQGKSGTLSPTQTSLTKPGSVLGTVGYMAPEQVRGEPADHRADIFSFGTMLHEMLTGRRPFERDTPAETMTAILREEPGELPESASDVPAALMRVVRRCLEKQPDERFQSARDLAFAIENSTQVSGIRPPSSEPLEAPGRRRAIWPVLVLAGLVGLAAGWFLRGGEEAITREPPKIRRLTVSGSDRQPSASPDGRMVAFTSSRDGTPRIWLKQLAGGGEQALTEGPDVQPRFSPDGSTILFLRQEGSRLSVYRQALVGGQARKLVEDASETCWAPDGRRFAFLRLKSDGTRQLTEVWVTDAQQGGDGTRAHSVERALYGLRWSPDGESLSAIETSVTGNASNLALILIDPEGGVRERNLEDQPVPLSPALWIDPDTVVLARAGSLLGDQGDPLSRVVRRDLRSGTETTLFWTRNLFPTQGVRIDFVEFDVAGPGELVFHQTDVRQHLRLESLEDSSRAPVWRELAGGEGRDRQPVFSPDGRSVLFSSNRSGNLDLWRLDLENGSTRQITDDAAQDWDPGFTPDGRSIVWSSDRGGNLEIWMADRDGSNARQITRDGVDAENPTFTADGEWIVYWSANPDKYGVWKIRADGSDATRLVPGAYMQPDVSPDGRYASYVAIETNLLSNTVRVLDVEGGEVLPFTIEIPTPLNAPSIVLGRTRWLPDGSAIAYVGMDERGRTGIYAQDFVPGRATGGTRRKIAGFSPDYVSESFGISPDGKRIVVAGIRRSFRLMLAENVPGITAPGRKR